MCRYARQFYRYFRPYFNFQSTNLGLMNSTGPMFSIFFLKNRLRSFSILHGICTLFVFFLLFVLGKCSNRTEKKPHTRTTHARAYIKLLCLCSLDSSKHMKMSVFIRSASKTANSKTRSATRTHAARRVSAYFSIEHKMSIEFRVLTSRVPWNF